MNNYLKAEANYRKACESNCKNCEEEFYLIPLFCYLYAKNILKKRLKDESVFLGDMSHAVYYARDVIKGRLPEEIEEVFFNKKTKCFYNYGSVYEESEVELDPYFYLLEYSKVIGRLPTRLHNFMILNSCFKNQYISQYFKII
jgi:hypothetical protein